MAPDQENTSRLLWQISLFGELRARRGSQVIERFPTRKTAGLLAALALDPRRRFPREELIDLLWPDAELAAGRDRLSQALVWLRPQLEGKGLSRGSVLVADRLSVGLDPAALTTDVAQFERALDRAGHSGEAPEQRAALAEAVALYQGELLTGFYDGWVLNERQRLLNLYLLALHRLVLRHEEDGEHEPALDYARRALAADPLQEEAHGDLIRLLAASGQTAAALRQYEVLRGRLAAELDSEPSAASQALWERIRREQAMRMPAPPPRSPRTLPLPVSLTRFFGREAEIERVREMIQGEGAKLVTLLGTGGSGKTRLALASAARLAGDFADAVAFVPLADLDDAAAIPAAIAAALRLPFSDALLHSQILEALSEKPFLLVLDNLEHLLAGAASLIHDLSAQTPTLTLLVTSRQRLGLDGEREMPVLPLSLPTSDATPAQIAATASVQLFCDRARAVCPDFAVTPANAETIAGVCVRLEGIPLALELCAAWAQMLTPAQMLEKLARRFDLLVSRRTDITPRHRTLRAAVEYSYLQLPGELQRLFVRLSVFRGGWSLEAAEAVCSEEADPDSVSFLSRLTELRERSLIVTEEVGTQGRSPEMRYRILETLREFAGEQLTFADRAVRRRFHADYFLRLAEQAETAAAGRDPEAQPMHLDREHENLGAALAWCLEAGEAETGLRLAIALCRHWSLRGHLNEGYHWLHRLLALSSKLTSNGQGPQDALAASLLAKAWSSLGHLAWAQGNYATARDAHAQALALRRETGDQEGLAESLYRLGITAYRQDDYPAARAFLEESLSIAQVRDDKAGIARVFLNLGNLAYEQQRHDEARQFFERSLALEQELGNRQRSADALNNLGLIALADRDFSRGATLFEQALAVYQVLADHYSTATVLMNLGVIARLQDQKVRARTLLAEGLTLAHEVGNKHMTAHCLLQLGLLSAAEEAPDRAVRLIAASRRLFETMGSVGASPDSPASEESEPVLSAARAALGEQEFAALWSQGRGFALGEAVAEAKFI